MRPSAVPLWGMVAALLLGLIAMHHAPGHGGHGGHSGVTHSEVRTADGCDCPPEPSSSPGPGGESSSLELLLHLCLAILGVGVALLVARLLLHVLRFLPGAPRRPSVTAARVARAPPLTPVPRRLAALCVLRI